MKKILISITISSIFLFGCSNSSDSANKASDFTADTSAMTEAPIITNVPAQMPSTDSTISATTPVSPTGVAVQTAATGNSGPNPAHGEPGHRCDIAVGAPLNSPAATVAAPAATPGNVTPAPAAAAAPVVTAPGTNPPHGQPGHDCKIAVGAPLPK